VFEGGLIRRKWRKFVLDVKMFLIVQ
jgi:hypothetical protein